MMINYSYNNYSFIECLLGSVPPTASLYIVGDFSLFFFMYIYMWSVLVYVYNFYISVCTYVWVFTRGWSFL